MIECDQPSGLSPFKYNVWSRPILIVVSYVDQLAPSIECCKFGLFSPLFFNVKVESALAVITTCGLIVTTTSHVAVYPPSCVVTVIVAVPLATAVIVPFETVATLVLVELQATDLSVAYSGNTVGIRVSVSSINKVVEGIFSLTSVTWIKSFFSDPQLVDIAATAPITVISNEEPVKS